MKIILWAGLFVAVLLFSSSQYSTLHAGGGGGSTGGTGGGGGLSGHVEAHNPTTYTGGSGSTGGMSYSEAQSTAGYFNSAGTGDGYVTYQASDGSFGVKGSSNMSSGGGGYANGGGGGYSNSGYSPGDYTNPGGGSNNSGCGKGGCSSSSNPSFGSGTTGTPGTPPPVTGCMNQNAMNYNANATIAGSCTYPQAPTITFSAEAELVRQDNPVTLTWNPKGFQGSCTLTPDQYFTSSDATSAGTTDVSLTSETTFTYTCSAPADVYAAPSNNQTIDVTVRVLPRMFET